jgi:hypothetical protein
VSKGLFKRESTRTIIFAVATLSLLLAIWLIAANIRTDRPVTLGGVTAEVIAGVSEFQDALPKSAVVAVVDEKHVEACPDGSGGKQVVISRTITTTRDFDRLQWLSNLSVKYQKKGWHSSTQTLDSRDHVSLKLVGLPLIIYRITSTDVESPQLIIRSVSRCSEQPGD